jgi:predicted molibdopterin-dependent oxidoreductase YjgC
VHPLLLPGGRTVTEDADRSLIEVAWGTLLPKEPGRDTAAILEAAASRQIEILFLVGVDPLRDFPDAALAQRALQNVPYKVVVDIASGDLDIYADAVLPGAPYLEKDGHYTNWEGRTQRLRPARNPQGLARSEWEIFQELSQAMGKDIGFHSLDDLHEEMGRVLGSDRAAVDAATPHSLAPPDRGGPPGGYAPPSPSTGPESTASPHTDPDAAHSSSVTLFTYPLLVDEGRLSAGAEELKAALEEQPFIEIHPSDAERLGVTEGASIRLRTQAGEGTLPVRITDGIAQGAAFVPYNQPGFAANTLLSGSTTTSVTLEPATQESTA